MPEGGPTPTQFDHVGRNPVAADPVRLGLVHGFNRQDALRLRAQVNESVGAVNAHSPREKLVQLYVQYKAKVHALGVTWPLWPNNNHRQGLQRQLQAAQIENTQLRATLQNLERAGHEL